MAKTAEELAEELRAAEAAASSGEVPDPDGTATDNTLPARLDPYGEALRQLGLVTPIATDSAGLYNTDGTPNTANWLLTNLGVDRLLNVYSASTGNESSDWAEVSNWFTAATGSVITAGMDKEFPELAQPYRKVTDLDGHPDTYVGQEEITALGTFLPDFGPSDLDDAVRAGTRFNVPWQLVAFASSRLNIDKLDDGSGEIRDVPTGSGEAAEIEAAEAANIGRSAGKVAGLLASGQSLAFDQPASIVAPIEEDPTDQSKGFDRVASQMSEGMNKYGNSVEMAYLYVLDPSLAETIVHDPNALSRDQNNALDDYLTNLRSWDSRYAIEGLNTNTQAFKWLESLDPDERVEIETTPTADAREAYRGVYQDWFLSTPSDAELDRFATHLQSEQTRFIAEGREAEVSPYHPLNQLSQGQVTGTPGLSDPMIMAAQSLRADPRYNELFGNMGEGLAEEDYVRAMQLQAGNVLGEVQGLLNTDAIKAGMASGDPNSVRRQAIASGTAQDSSVFRERQANRAARLRELT